MNTYLNTLKQWYKFPNFRDKQLDIIRSIIEDKRDVCAIMFTGSGKSLCFQFPAIHTNKICIVVSPLISLMNDQKLKLNELKVPSCTLNSTVFNKNTLKNEILENKYRLVYTTPEYLITQEDFIKELEETGNLLLFCVDEAHCTSTWGNDFREAYKKLFCLREWTPNIPIMALTATATKKVQNDIINILQLKNQFIVKTTFDRPNLVIRIIPKGPKPMDDLLHVIKEDEPTIVYCQTRNMTDKISEQLNKNKIKSKSYHAGMNAGERNNVHEEFAGKIINCVVATIAFGMGIDITIRKVIHYGISKDMESYYQEIGRAGRDGLKSECYLFYALSDMNNNNYFLNQIKNIQYRNHMLQLALTMKNFIFSSQCRRKYILEYFGEEYTKNNCGACDICLSNKVVVSYDFSKEAKLVFDTINFTGNTWGGIMIINILRGSNNKKIKPKHTKLKQFGAGTHRSEKWWRIFFTMLINEEYLKEQPISGGHAFTLANTKESLDWLKLAEKKPDTKLILEVPEDMKLLLPQKENKEKSLNFEKDEIEIGEILDEMIENVYGSKSNLSMQSKLDTTYNMFQVQKKSIKEIANYLDVNQKTVEGYLVRLYEQDKELDLNRLKFDDETYNNISKKIIELDNPSMLSTIKNNLPYNISYLQIKLTQVKMNKIGKNQATENKINPVVKSTINYDEIINNIKKGLYFKPNKNIDDEYNKLLS
jgi:Werner syndrome ATP-dependent helicase